MLNCTDVCHNEAMNKLRVIITDISGIGLIILAILTGWIPGPGGIPLFLTGLSLIAINHEWARRWLRWLKTTGLKLAEKFFRDHPVLMAIYDVLALLLVAAGVIVLLQAEGGIKTLAFILFSVGLALFLGNRNRLKRILNKFNNKT